MTAKRVFISGAMASHELDFDRESARAAINALLPEFTAFGFEPFPAGQVPLLESEARSKTMQFIAQCDALILLIGKRVSNYCLWEFDLARKLGLPCGVFAKDQEGAKSRVRTFLRDCPCPIVSYSDPLTDLRVSVQRFCRALMIGGDEKQGVLIHTVNVWKSIIRELCTSPEKVFQLSPRKFEELLAEIIASFGYTTSLTPCTRDGGFDILAKRKDPLFPSVYLVEAKLWTPPRAVGRPVIQGIYGTGMAENCNGVMVVTPSMFSRDAITFLDDKKLKEYIRLVDGVELPSLYKHYLDGAIEA